MNTAALFSQPTMESIARRNSDRFPGDFMFQLTTAEKKEVITKCDHLTNLKSDLRGAALLDVAQELQSFLVQWLRKSHPELIGAGRRP